MLKVTYKVLANFSLKRYKDGHLSSRSYPYATSSSIRGSILGAMIQRKGKKIAEENFHKLKNVQIFIQHPTTYTSNQSKMKMFSNSTYAKDGTIGTTVGIREYVAVKEIVFYLDETLLDIIEYLENINRIGNSESMVQLKSVEKVTVMENILMDWDKSMGFDTELVENYDWDTSNKGMTFEKIYLFSKKRGTVLVNKTCFIKEVLEIPTLIELSTN